MVESKNYNYGNVWRILAIVLFVCTFSLANNIIYSKSTTIQTITYKEQDKVTINAGVKVTYASWAENRGYFVNNGEIANNSSNLSNNVGATFIHNGKMTMGQFNNYGTAIFYSDATAICSAGCNGFRNTKGGTFYIIGATLTTDIFEMADAFSWTPQPNPPQNTLIFGICDSNKCGYKMGQINGNFLNASKNGVIQVNIANMTYGQKYTIITGTITGLDNVIFVGTNLSDYITHYENGEVWIEQKNNPNPNPNPDNPYSPPPFILA